MPRRIKSQSLGVNTLFTPLSVTMSMENVSGVADRQWYYANATAWSPDYSLTPLMLRPIVNAVNPEDGTSFTPPIQNVTWVETLPDGTVTSFTAESGVAGYSVAADGTLTMTKNVPALLAGLTLTCIVTYADTRRGLNEKVEQTITVALDVSADETYKISLKPSHQYYNPLDASDNPVKYINATAFLGESDVTADVKFFWYYVNNGAEVAVDDTANPLLAFVGYDQQAWTEDGETVTPVNHRQLVVNADYDTENLTLVCRIGSGMTAATPDVEHVSRRATVRWRIPAVRGFVDVKNGDTARLEIARHQFGAVFRQGGRDISDDTSRQRIIKTWRLKNTTTGATTLLGTGHTIDVPEGMLYNGNGVQMNVECEGAIVSPLMRVVDDVTGAVVVDDVTGAIVVGRTTETEE